MSEGPVMGVMRRLRAVVPVDKLGTPTDDVEVVLLPATDAISAVYRDDVHLSAGRTVVERLREYAVSEGLSLDGEPRWVYHTSPEWNLEPATISSRFCGRSGELAARFPPLQDVVGDLADSTSSSFTTAPRSACSAISTCGSARLLECSYGAGGSGG